MSTGICVNEHRRLATGAAMTVEYTINPAILLADLYQACELLRFGQPSE